MGKVDRRTKEGRGQGSGSNYTPYNKTQDMHSRSNRTRIKSLKTNRVYHLQSELHLSYFYLLDFAENITDIQEEFPLPLDATRQIADSFGLTHPAGKDGPKVVTLDFRVTVQKNGAEQIFARAVRTSSALSGRRGLSQLEIQMLYFQTLGIDWGIITEIEFPTVLARNIESIHGFYCAEGNVPIPPDQLQHISRVLTHEVQTDEHPLSSITNSVDNRLGLKPGSSLSLAKHLIAARKWRIDMYRPFSPVERLVLLEVDRSLLQ